MPHTVAPRPLCLPRPLLPFFNRPVLFSRLTTPKLIVAPRLCLPHLFEPTSYFCWSLVTQLVRVFFLFILISVRFKHGISIVLYKYANARAL